MNNMSNKDEVILKIGDIVELPDDRSDGIVVEYKNDLYVKVDTGYVGFGGQYRYFKITPKLRYKIKYRS